MVFGLPIAFHGAGVSPAKTIQTPFPDMTSYNFGVYV